MLHTSSPAAYIAAEKLAESAKCPDCGADASLAAGVLHLGHYNFNGEAHQGLIWTCSDKCFLSWEHPQFMGHA
jgi:hypothetical protein